MNGAICKRFLLISVADPDIQIRVAGWGGGGNGHPDPEIRGGGGGVPGLKKTFFRPFGPQFSLKIRGEGHPGPLP